MAVEGRLLIHGGPNAPWMECGAALVKTDVSQKVDASRAQVVLVFVDPESDLRATLIEDLENRHHDSQR